MEEKHLVDVSVFGENVRVLLNDSSVIEKRIRYIKADLNSVMIYFDDKSTLELRPVSYEEPGGFSIGF
ncbi:hypothetical protein MYP_1474 [Sporocytophaga myxococcoides]|uniref:Uncharacterized protein n=1 Tax=Sporocytophaga myxococcoides TaxID=153721 RepID=A0A098LBI0_9BACT|nr:hypothetical protein [Sporocytophaga myxococcoides]GAL84246.1 hypothetical protein MYP_1474 [Sporocytophaga myxococcoides]